jgi:hypothetical protein
LLELERLRELETGRAAEDQRGLVVDRVGNVRPQRDGIVAIQRRVRQPVKDWHVDLRVRMQICVPGKVEEAA